MFDVQVQDIQLPKLMKIKVGTSNDNPILLHLLRCQNDVCWETSRHRQGQRSPYTMTSSKDFAYNFPWRYWITYISNFFYVYKALYFLIEDYVWSLEYIFFFLSEKFRVTIHAFIVGHYCGSITAKPRFFSLDDSCWVTQIQECFVLLSCTVTVTLSQQWKCLVSLWLVLLLVVFSQLEKLVLSLSSYTDLYRMVDCIADFWFKLLHNIFH